LVTSDAHDGLVAAVPPCPRRPGSCAERTTRPTPMATITLKTSRPLVPVLLHSVYDQSDADSVAAQFDRLIDALTNRLQSHQSSGGCPRGLVGVQSVYRADLAPDLVEQPPKKERITIDIERHRVVGIFPDRQRNDPPRRPRTAEPLQNFCSSMRPS
jgi:putative transposase